MLLQDEEVVLLAIVDWVLLTVLWIQSTSVWLQEQAEDELEHESMQFHVCIELDIESLSLVELFLAHLDDWLLLDLSR